MLLLLGLPVRQADVLDAVLLSQRVSVRVSLPVLLAQVWLEGPQEPLVPSERVEGVLALPRPPRCSCRLSCPSVQPCLSGCRS